MQKTFKLIGLVMMVLSLIFGYSALAADYNREALKTEATIINQLKVNPVISPTALVHAEDVVAGSFGANAGGGNYSFPASLYVGPNALINGLSGASYFNGGYVGIGTNNPTEALEVVGNIKLNPDPGVSGQIYLGGYSYISKDLFLLNSTTSIQFGNGAYMQQEPSAFKFGGSSRFWFQGLVGINTANPDTTLHVNGSLKANSYYAANGSVGISNVYHLKANTGQNCTMTFSNGLLTASTCP